METTNKNTKARKPFIEWLPEFLREYILKQEFPFLLIRDINGTPMKSTFWMSIPKGWRWKFGWKFCFELKKAIHNSGYECDEFHITDVKEKFGCLDVSFDHYTNNIIDIIEKYTNLSYRTCIECGADAEGHTISWILPMCMACFNNIDPNRRRMLNFKNDINGKRDLEVENDEYNYGHQTVEHNISE